MLNPHAMPIAILTYNTTERDVTMRYNCALTASLGLAHHLLGGGAPAGSGAEGVGQLALLGYGNAAIEARVDLLPLLTVDLHKGRRGHRAVKVRRAVGDLVGGVLGAGWVLADELFADGNILGPFAQVNGARLDVWAPQNGSEGVGALEALDENLA